MLAVAGVACWLAASVSAAPHPRIDIRPNGLNGTHLSLSQHEYVSRCEPGKTKIEVSAAHGFSYRANPVPGGVISRADLRKGMDRIAKRSSVG